MISVRKEVLTRTRKLNILRNKQTIVSMAIFCLSSAALAMSLFLRLTLDMKPCTSCNRLATLALIIYVASAMTIFPRKNSRRMRLLPLILLVSFLGAMISGLAYSQLGCASCSSQYKSLSFLGFSIYLYALGFNTIVLRARSPPHSARVRTLLTRAQ